jgi:hypothetical protein
VNEAPKSRIKLAALLVTLVGVASLCCLLLYVFINVSENSLRDSRAGMPMPWLTLRCLDFRLCILLLPVPWLAVAVWLISRNDSSAFRLVAFSSTLLLALVSATIFIIIALALPWLPFRISFSR